jgi:hypothetical protein
MNPANTYGKREAVGSKLAFLSKRKATVPKET